MPRSKLYPLLTLFLFFVFSKKIPISLVNVPPFIDGYLPGRATCSFRFIGTVSKAMGLNFPGGPRASMLASLDHSMFFYDQLRARSLFLFWVFVLSWVDWGWASERIRTSDFEVSEWMLYKMDAETAKNGRGLVIGRIYARDGRLLAVCVSHYSHPAHFSLKACLFLFFSLFSSIFDTL